MARRRMFSKQITGSDAFLNMPLSAQALYFQLGMNADDDGVVDNANQIVRMLGCNQDDLLILIAKKFVYVFKEHSVLVIKHWKMNNLIKSDRYTSTNYIEVKQMLFMKKNGSYTLDPHQGVPLIESKSNGTQMEPKWNPNGNTGKDSIGKDSIGKDRVVSSRSTLNNLDQSTPNRSGDPLATALTTFLYHKDYLKSPDDDVNQYRYNDLFKELVNKFTIKNVNQSLKYVLTFANTEQIEDKYNWLYTALYDNCNKFDQKGGEQES